MTTLTQAPTYLILGAGCFGASTAYHLITEYPNAQITLIDRGPFPNPTAAAHDLNKIIRADYPDLVYMRLAHESQEQWRYEPLFRPFYHETGMLFVEDFGMGRKTYDNHKKLFGEKSSAELLDPDVAQQSFDGVFKTAHWTGVKKNYYNPRSGWAEADKAMTALIQAAVDRGVRYLGDGVAKLLFDDNSKCTGVLTGNGQVLHADRIVLAAGASIAQLLADSAPRNKDLQVNGRQIAAAATSCYLFVPENRRQRLKNAPVVFNGLDHTHGNSSSLSEKHVNSPICPFRRIGALDPRWLPQIQLRDQFHKLSTTPRVGPDDIHATLAQIAICLESRCSRRTQGKGPNRSQAHLRQRGRRPTNQKLSYVLVSYGQAMVVDAFMP